MTGPKTGHQTMQSNKFWRVLRPRGEFGLG